MNLCETGSNPRLIFVKPKSLEKYEMKGDGGFKTTFIPFYKKCKTIKQTRTDKETA